MSNALHARFFQECVARIEFDVRWGLAQRYRLDQVLVRRLQKDVAFAASRCDGDRDRIEKRIAGLKLLENEANSLPREPLPGELVLRMAAVVDPT